MIRNAESVQEFQHTVKASRRFSGITLHTGVRAHVTLKPAPPDSGIQVVRVDLPDRPMIQASAANVIDAQRATTIASSGASVHTVEHVLAALYACGVDNAVIEMDGPEPPIADGSSAPFVTMIQDAGVEPQKVARRFLRICRPVVVVQGESRLIMIPRDHGFRISCTVKYGDGMLDTQYLSLVITAESFIAELARARTFCLYAEIEGLMVSGLIQGGSLDNAVVLKDGAIISKEGLRYSDEFVRHKMLDIVGDLSLVGRRFIGEVIAIKPGHPINVAMANKLLQNMEEADGQQERSCA